MTLADGMQPEDARTDDDTLEAVLAWHRQMDRLFNLAIAGDMLAAREYLERCGELEGTEGDA